MSEPVAGKFLLEILTKGMYSNPIMSIENIFKIVRILLTRLLKRE